MGDYLRKSITRGEGEGVHAIIIELDTPGGLLSSTKDIVSDILNAEVPVIVFVSPRGAWAGSAGTFITLAGHVAAMAPGTSIGAAHPVPAMPTSEPPATPGAEDEKGDESAFEALLPEGAPSLLGSADGAAAAFDEQKVDPASLLAPPPDAEGEGSEGEASNPGDQDEDD